MKITYLGHSCLLIETNSSKIIVDPFISGNPLAMAAGSTLLNLLIDNNPYKKLEEKAELMLDGMHQIMSSAGIPFSTNQIGGMFGFFFF